MIAVLPAGDPVTLHRQCGANHRSRSVRAHDQSSDLVYLDDALVGLKCEDDISHHLRFGHAMDLDLTSNQRRFHIASTDRVVSNPCLGNFQRHNFGQSNSIVLGRHIGRFERQCHLQIVEAKAIYIVHFGVAGDVIVRRHVEGCSVCAPHVDVAQFPAYCAPRTKAS